MAIFSSAGWTTGLLTVFNVNFDVNSNKTELPNHQLAKLTSFILVDHTSKVVFF